MAELSRGSIYDIERAIHGMNGEELEKWVAESEPCLNLVNTLCQQGKEMVLSKLDLTDDWLDLALTASARHGCMELLEQMNIDLNDDDLIVQTFAIADMRNKPSVISWLTEKTGKKHEEVKKENTYDFYYRFEKNSFWLVEGPNEYYNKLCRK